VSCFGGGITQRGGDMQVGMAQEVTANSSRLSVKALPNPSPSHFTLQVASARSERVTIRIMDMLGRIVETKIIAANTNLQVGSTLRPGTYLAEVVQGAEKQTLKLVKTGAF
jgi:hypothetical protein